ncbi:MAG TPA: tetratricopeptide repeat protein [Stellaceae bacterium]|jgi:capsular polysaccharide transport system permease protein|nr:tetratricopeptide repeat protein [Stellaceae bacterium]
MSLSSEETPDLTLDTPVEIVRELIASRERLLAMSESELLIASEIAYRNVDYTLAITAMMRLLDIVPGKAEHHFRLGVLQRCAQQAGAAERALRRAIALNPQYEPAHIELVALLNLNDEIEKALTALAAQEHAIGVSPTLAVLRAGLLRRSKRPAEALAALQPHLDTGVDSEVLYAAAELALEMRRWHDAVAYARELCARSPDVKAYRRLFAHALCVARQFEEAIPILEQQLREDAADIEAVRLLSISFAETGRYHQALESAVRATQLSPESSEFWHRAAEVARILGHTAEAEAWLAHALALDPTNPALLISHAHLLAGLGRLNDALAAIDTAKRLYPDEASLRELQIMFLSRLNEEFVVAENPSDTIGPMPKIRRGATIGNNEGLSALLHGARVQCRVIAALTMREMAHRTAHSKFGLVSAIVEPSLQIVMLGIVLKIFNNGRPPLGNDLFFFYSTGVLPYYLFLHIVEHTQNVYLDNASVLQVPRIRRADLVIAVALAELLIGAMTTTFVFGLFFALGYGEDSDIAQAIFAYLATWLFALGIGMIGSVINNLTRLWERSWVTVARFLYFLSGIFFIPQMMPDWIREILVWNPLLVGIEWFRSGLFFGYSPPWIDKPFMLTISFACLVTGLVLERGLRKRLRVSHY